MIDERTAGQRRLDGLALHRIEGNPLDAEDIAMFEMFDREGWSLEQRRAYIVAKAQQTAPSKQRND